MFRPCVEVAERSGRAGEEGPLVVEAAVRSVAGAVVAVRPPARLVAVPVVADSG
jgi:hypothetical protein